MNNMKFIYVLGVILLAAGTNLQKSESAWGTKKDWGNILKGPSSGNPKPKTSQPVAHPQPPPKVPPPPSGGSTKSSQSSVETSALKFFSEEVFALDSGGGRLGLSLNYQGKLQGKSNVDAAPQPLFSSPNSRVLNEDTTKKMIKLFDNYVADVKKREDYSNVEGNEINAFLDALMKTEVMKKTESFLRDNGLISGDFRKLLNQIWFEPYSRSRGVSGSSGFEHVFLGEIKNGKVSGFHNWVYFQNEEQEKDLNYQGYFKVIDLGNERNIAKLKFDWLNKPKSLGSMFIGTSPELEMALYTVCFYARPNRGCSLQMNGKKLRIKVYRQDYEGKHFVGSAFPEVY